jgi:hypothetical protein
VLEIQIYVGSKTLPNNTLVSMLLVTFAFNLALILSLESFCIYFLVISIWNFLVSFMKSVLFVWGLSLLCVKTMSKLCIVVFSDIRAVTMTVCWHYLLFQFSNFEFSNLAI